LLLAIEKKKIVKGDFILIEAVDRLGRLKPLEMLPLMSRIIEAGVTIVSLDDSVEYNDESLNQGFLQVLAGKFHQAYQYSHTLS
jgi:DNA invertase Pin-like site-specific DNA recombinase